MFSFATTSRCSMLLTSSPERLECLPYLDLQFAMCRYFYFFIFFITSRFLRISSIGREPKTTLIQISKTYRRMVTILPYGRRQDNNQYRRRFGVQDSHVLLVHESVSLSFDDASLLLEEYNTMHR